MTLLSGLIGLTTRVGSVWIEDGCCHYRGGCSILPNRGLRRAEYVEGYARGVSCHPGECTNRPL